MPDQGGTPGKSSAGEQSPGGSMTARKDFRLQATLAWTFPIWWLICFQLYLSATTRLARQCGFELTTFIPPQFFYSAYLLIPIAWGLFLFFSSDWFRKQFIFMLMFWVVLWCALDVTQSSLHMAFWSAMGFPIEDSLNSLEQKASELFLPKRCQSMMNERATMALEMMSEQSICDSMPANFVYRLLIFNPGMEGPITCFRLEMDKDGTGTLYCKKMSHEPNVFAWRSERNNSAPVDTKKYSLSAAATAEALAQIAFAENYYQKNKYRSYWCIPRRGHYLLEFQTLGKYFYYDFQGDEPNNEPAPFLEPIPDFLTKLIELNTEITRSVH